MTDDSAFKRQVRDRMTAHGEKYTEARRRVIADAAIRDAVQRSMRGVEQAVGLMAVEVDFADDLVHVTVRAARPEVAWGLHRSREAEGVWRASAVARLHDELVELAGQRVRLDIRSQPARLR